MSLDQPSRRALVTGLVGTLGVGGALLSHAIRRHRSRPLPVVSLERRDVPTRRRIAGKADYGCVRCIARALLLDGLPVSVLRTVRTGDAPRPRSRVRRTGRASNRIHLAAVLRCGLDDGRDRRQVRVGPGSRRRPIGVLGLARGDLRGTGREELRLGYSREPPRVHALGRRRRRRLARVVSR